MHTFYDPSVTKEKGLLTGDEAIHCFASLRLQAGDPIRVVDGKGGIFEAVLSETGKKECPYVVKAVGTDDLARPWKLHVAIAPPKSSDRLEVFLEKAVEIGIDEITPIICDRSERRKTRTDRLERIAVSTMKQCRRASMPRINDAVKWNDFMKDPATGQGFICHLPLGTKTPDALIKQYKQGSDCTVLIGPEGDFTPEEVQLAIKQGYAPSSLGRSRLRTETAGLYACQAVHLINELAQ